MPFADHDAAVASDRRRAFLTAFPILLQGCGGVPVRAVAWEIEE